MNAGTNMLYVLLHGKKSLVNYVAFKEHPVLGTDFLKICKNSSRLAQDSFFPQSAKALRK